MIYLKNIHSPRISQDLEEKLILLFKQDYGLDNEIHLNFDFELQVQIKYSLH